MSLLLVFGMAVGVPAVLDGEDLITQDAAAGDCQFPEIKPPCCWDDMPEPLNVCWK